MITCLPHKGQSFVQKKIFNVFPSYKQVGKVSLKNTIVIARSKVTA